MKIGIKYCGGCNPRYDRTYLVKKITDEYKNLDFEKASDNVCYDLVMIICGCSRACANHDKLIGLQKIFICQESDYNKIKELLKSKEEARFRSVKNRFL